MIVGIGIDHCQISRMQKTLERFSARLERRYFSGEVAYCNRHAHRRDARFAMHFAAKEAAAKALGTGFKEGVSLSNIEVMHLPSGQPTLALHGKAKERLMRLIPAGMQANIQLSLTDEADMASAVCIIEASDALNRDF